MSNEIITKAGTLLSREGFVTHTGVEVAYHEEDGDQYIRVGNALYWRKDLDESKAGRMTCLASGAVILL